MAALLSWERRSSASLFERIQRGKRESLSRHNRMPELLTSITTHLNNVLNSRPGACQSALELGVIDLNDATAATSDFRKSIAEAIQRCIENYEPRVSNVSVVPAFMQEDPLALHFRISAQVVLENRVDVIEFNILLDHNRRYCLDQEE